MVTPHFKWGRNKMFSQDKKLNKSLEDRCVTAFATVIAPYLPIENLPNELSTSATYIFALSRNILLMRDYIPQEITPSLINTLIRASENLEEDTDFFIEKTFNDYDITFKNFPEKLTKTKNIERCRFYFKTDGNSIYYAFRKVGGGIFKGNFSENDFPDATIFKRFQLMIEKQENEKSNLQDSETVINFKNSFIEMLTNTKENNQEPEKFLINYLKKVVICLQIITDWLNNQNTIYDERKEVLEHDDLYIKEKIIKYINKIEKLSGQFFETTQQAVADFLQDATYSTNDLVLKAYYMHEAVSYQAQAAAKTCKETVIPDTVGNIQESPHHLHHRKPANVLVKQNIVDLSPKFTGCTVVVAQKEEESAAMSWLIGAFSKLTLFPATPSSQQQSSPKNEISCNKKDA